MEEAERRVVAFFNAELAALGWATATHELQVSAIACSGTHG